MALSKIVEVETDQFNQTHHHKEILSVPPPVLPPTPPLDEELKRIEIEAPSLDMLETVTDEVPPEQETVAPEQLKWTGEMQNTVKARYGRHDKQQKRERKQQIEGQWRRFTLISLFIAPLIISTMSMIHLYDLFIISNLEWMSVCLCVSFEILTITTLISMRQFGIFSNGVRSAIWGVIFFLAALQVFGNMFSNYLKIDEDLCKIMAEMLNMTYGASVKRIVSMGLGSLLPLTGLVFFKTLAVYWHKTQR